MLKSQGVSDIHLHVLRSNNTVQWIYTEHGTIDVFNATFV